MKITFAALALLPFLASAQNALEFCADHIRFGAPSTTGTILCREGYVLSHNASTKVADWVAYRVIPTQLDGPFDRTDDFREDEDLPTGERSTPDDYDEPNFDQGHMAPADLFTTDPSAMSESFLMSNMAPQNGSLNSGGWKGLENRVQKWTKSRGELYVVSGPVYDPSATVSTIGDGVHVPDGFYKVIFDPVRVEAIAFILPNERVLTADLPNRLESVDEVEKLTGFDFLPELVDDVEALVEGTAQTAVWN